MTPQLKLVFFTAKTCPTCQHVKKNVLPLFQKQHPDLKIEEVQIGLDKPSKDAIAEARADVYGIQSVPAFAFELHVPEELPKGHAGDATLNGLNQLLKKAQEVVSAVQHS